MKRRGRAYQGGYRVGYWIGAVAAVFVFVGIPAGLIAVALHL